MSETRDPQQLRKIEKDLSAFLYTNIGKDQRPKFLRYMLSSILSSEISSKQKKYLKYIVKTTLSELMNSLNGNIQPEKIINFVEQKYEEAYPTESTDRMFSIEDLKKINITDKDWTLFREQFGISSDKNIVYKGGVARLVARHLLKTSNTPYEKLNDIDAYVSDEANIEEIAKKFNSDPQGFSVHKDISPEAIANKLHKVDCTLNQLFVTNNALYLSPTCEKALKTGITEPCHQGVDMYSTHSFEKEGEIIYASRTLGRLIKFLAEGKIQGIRIKKHNILPENLQQLDIENDMLVNLRKFIFIENTQEQVEHFKRLDEFFRQINLLDKNSDIFDYFTTLLTKNPKFNLEKPLGDIEGKARRLVTKLIKLEKEKLAPTNKTLLENYDSSKRDIVEIILPNELTIDDDFKEKFSDFMKQDRIQSVIVK